MACKHLEAPHGIHASHRLVRREFTGGDRAQRCAAMSELQLAEIAGEKVGSGVANGGPDDRRAAELCAEAMRNAASVAAETAAPHADAHSIPDKSRPAAPDSPAFDAQATPCEDALVVVRWNDRRQQFYVLTSYPEDRR